MRSAPMESFLDGPHCTCPPLPESIGNGTRVCRAFLKSLGAGVGRKKMEGFYKQLEELQVRSRALGFDRQRNRCAPQTRVLRFFFSPLSRG